MPIDATTASRSGTLAAPRSAGCTASPSRRAGSRTDDVALIVLDRPCARRWPSTRRSSMRRGRRAAAVGAGAPKARSKRPCSLTASSHALLCAVRSMCRRACLALPVQAGSRTASPATSWCPVVCPPAGQARLGKYKSRSAGGWALLESNQRPPACKGERRKARGREIMYSTSLPATAVSTKWLASEGGRQRPPRSKAAVTEGQSTMQPGFGLSRVRARLAGAANVATTSTGLVPSFRAT